MPASARMTVADRSLTIFRQSAVAEHVDHTLPDRRLGGLKRHRDAEGNHQGPHGAAMSDSDRVYNKGIEPLAHSQRDTRIALARRRGDTPFVLVAGGASRSVVALHF